MASGKGCISAGFSRTALWSVNRARLERTSDSFGQVMRCRDIWRLLLLMGILGIFQVSIACGWWSSLLFLLCHFQTQNVKMKSYVWLDKMEKEIFSVSLHSSHTLLSRSQLPLLYLFSKGDLSRLLCNVMWHLRRAYQSNLCFHLEYSDLLCSDFFGRRDQSELARQQEDLLCWVLFWIVSHVLSIGQELWLLVIYSSALLLFL